MGRYAQQPGNVLYTSQINEEEYPEQSQRTYTTNTPPRIVMLHGNVTEETIANATAQLLYFASIGSEPISLVLSTYGGSVHEMFVLYDTIKFLPCPVYTIALGKLMSAGVLILASGEKGKRLIGQSTRIMMHSISAGAFGNIFEITNLTDEYQLLQKQMTKALIAETGMTKKLIHDLMSTKLDRYMGPDEAIKLGIVDKIMG